MNNTRESWFTKIIKFFYGVRGPLDEYKQQIVNRLGNQCYIILSSYLYIITCLAFLLSKVVDARTLLYYIIIGNFAILLILGSYTGKTVRKHHLDAIEVYDNDHLKAVKRGCLHRAIISSIAYFLFSDIFLNGYNMLHDGLDGLGLIITTSIYIGGAIVLGITKYHFDLKRIKK